MKNRIVQNIHKKQSLKLAEKLNNVSDRVRYKRTQTMGYRHRRQISEDNKVNPIFENVDTKTDLKLKNTIVGVTYGLNTGVKVVSDRNNSIPECRSFDTGVNN